MKCHWILLFEPCHDALKNGSDLGFLYSKEFEDFFDMAWAFDIAKDLYNDAFFINQKSGAFHAQDLDPLHESGFIHTIEPADFHIFIAQEKEGDAVFCDGLIMGIEGFDADTENPDAQAFKLGKMIAEVAQESGAVRSLILCVKEKKERSAHKIAETHLIAITCGDDKIRRLRAFIQIV